MLPADSQGAKQPHTLSTALLLVQVTLSQRTQEPDTTDKPRIAESTSSACLHVNNLLVR